jgi:pimeloyl-ACP methyl ester carboxylesterase
MMGTMTVTYRTVDVDGIPIFYREAGDPARPALLLLHGFPSSSRMFEPLLHRLGDRFHLIAPDYPGFGHSGPAREATFDHLAAVMTGFAETLGLSSYAMYVQDYGGPVGMRMNVADPSRLRALIVQNAVSHDVGLGPLWEPRKAFWSDRAAHEAALRENFLSLAATRLRHVGRSPFPERYDPDLWTDEFRFLNTEGQPDFQVDLFYDYRTNVASYPVWQQWLREHQPRLLVLWGTYDPSFETAAAHAYRDDVPNARVELLEAGHFALDEQPGRCAGLIAQFLDE